MLFTSTYLVLEFTPTGDCSRKLENLKRHYIKALLFHRNNYFSIVEKAVGNFFIEFAFVLYNFVSLHVVVFR